MGDLLDVVAMLSAVGAGLGCASVGTRMLFAARRDGILRRELADVSTATGIRSWRSPSRCPSRSASSSAPDRGTAAITTFFYIATMGILSLLVMYIVTNVGALRYLFLGGVRRARLGDRPPRSEASASPSIRSTRTSGPCLDYPFNLFPYIVLLASRRLASGC